jgi:hypothetical protein
MELVCAAPSRNVEEFGIKVVDNAMLSQLNEFDDPWCNAEEASIQCGFGSPVGSSPDPTQTCLKAGA